jgi:molybdenum cofactor biosynthesis protein B
MSDAVNQHKEAAPPRVRFVALTVSDTRTLETDHSGALIVQMAQSAGHILLERLIVPDEPSTIGMRLLSWQSDLRPDAAFITGGTGIAPRDQTVEAVSGHFTKALPGFGELFRMLSFEEIGPAAMLSRATAGTMGEMLVFLMPGSRAAVELAMERLILPELAHAVGLLRPAHRQS